MGRAPVAGKLSTMEGIRLAFLFYAECLQRLIRLSLGILAQWYQPEEHIFADDALLSNFIPISEFWQQLDVPQSY